MAKRKLDRPQVPRKATLSERLDYYRAPDAETGCRLWNGGTYRGGYGQLNWQGRPRKAHRLAWEAAYGAPPAHLHVCHTCDQPACINPEHLFLGSIADNMADKVSKGRQERGESHGLAKFTDENIRAIRGDGRLQWEIAEDYGVQQSAISRIITRKRWKHI